MVSSYFYRKAFNLFTFVAVALLLAACGAGTQNPLSQQAASATPTIPYGCTVSASLVGLSLSKQINDSKEIFQGEIVKSEPLIWNSADGKAPADACTPDVYQYTPIEVHVTESYKGTLKTDDTVKLLLDGAPGALPYFTFYQFYPAKGESITWFLGESKNFRVGSTENPLVYPNIVEMFNHPTGKDWSSRIQPNTFASTDQLKELIKNPLPDPTPKFR